MIGVNIVGTNKVKAKISNCGEVATAPVSYSSPISLELGTADAAVNAVKPRTGFRVVITSLVIVANKNVGAGDATVEIYETNAVDSTTVAKQIFKFELIKQSSLVIPNLHIITNQGVWINAKTDDDDVFIFMAAHYLEAGIDSNLFI